MLTAHGTDGHAAACYAPRVTVLQALLDDARELAACQAETLRRELAARERLAGLYAAAVADLHEARRHATEQQQAVEALVARCSALERQMRDAGAG